MEIKELKKELGLSNKEIAQFFDLSPETYANSSAKKRYEAALCSFYDFVKSKDVGGNKEKIKKQIENNRDLIDKALSMDDVETVYYLVKKLAKDNEKLTALLKN